MFILSEGATLAGLGMAIVVVFLTVLVISIRLMSVLTHYFQSVPQANPSTAPLERLNASRDSELMVVMAAAIHRYRNS